MLHTLRDLHELRPLLFNPALSVSHIVSTCFGDLLNGRSVCDSYTLLLAIRKDCTVDLSMIIHRPLH